MNEENKIEISLEDMERISKEFEDSNELKQGEVIHASIRGHYIIIHVQFESANGGIWHTYEHSEFCAWCQK